MHAARLRQATLSVIVLWAAAWVASGQVIGFWDFDEGSPGNYASSAPGAIFDSSGNGNHLTATGSPELPFYVDGSPAYDSGSALNFLDPEDDRLYYPDGGGDTFDFGGSENFTIEAVVGSLVQPDVGAIVAKDGATAADPQWWFRHENGQLKFLISDGPNVSSITTATPLAKINDGAWHHVAAVRDADARLLRVYVDYQLVGTASDISVGSLANDTDMTIGGFANSVTREFGPGDIDFVKITTAALEPAQFEDMLPETPEVLALWDFEEGTPGTQATGASGEILDASGNARHADVVGEPGGYPTYVEGQCVSTALQFTAGTDAVQYPYSAPYPFDIPAGGTMTFELVLRTSASGIYQALVARDLEAAAQYWTRIKNDDTVQFFVSDGSGNGLNSTDVLLNDGEWHHVAFVRDGRREQLRYYVDYELVARTGEPTAGLVANTTPLTIAEFFSSEDPRAFVGEIDLVRVSSGALEPADFYQQCPDLQSDLDGDFDVDIDDFSIMQLEFTGPR